MSIHEHASPYRERESHRGVVKRDEVFYLPIFFCPSKHEHAFFQIPKFELWDCLYILIQTGMMGLLQRMWRKGHNHGVEWSMRMRVEGARFGA